jgi:hypothetical protein
MRKNLFLLIFLLSANHINAQFTKSAYIKLDNGFSSSSFQSKPDLDILENTNTNYSALLGIDFAQKKWFYFSSQIGYVRIGGNETNNGLIGTPNYKLSENSDYIHLNTTFRVATKRPGLNVYAGVGPYVSILVSSKNFKGDFFKDGYQFKQVYTGGKTEIGFTQDLQKIRFGLNGSYMFNVSPTATTGALNINSHTFLATLSLGYMIK